MSKKKQREPWNDPKDLAGAVILCAVLAGVAMWPMWSPYLS